MRTNTKILLSFSLATFFFYVQGREINKASGFRNASSNSNTFKVSAQCVGANGSKELWVNNVRAIIFTAGDMWWDLFGSSSAYYIVPAQKDRSKAPSSLFAGSIWIGGYDAGGQLRVAAMTYRQSGYDYWPGPLDITNASVTDEVCQKYDKIFSISRAEVESYVLNPGNPIPYNAQIWPGNGDPTYNQDQYLAPFEDVDGDGFYDPSKGDYPAFDIYNKAEKDNCGNCKARLFGDYCLWWVFNDMGNAHTETQGLPIGLEIRAQAFAFQTSDEINNMTFYSYQVINRSTFELKNTYFTVWTDADLGNYNDDYVGCDVARGLGYIYNADSKDESVSGAPGYEDYPPAIGADFFRGPLADPNDGIDNNFNGVIDEPCETIGMTNFTYYNNNIGSFPPQTTNPEIAAHYYGYMIGKWKDGSPFTFGGTAYGGATPLNTTNPEGRVLVYSGDPYAGTGWTEYSAGNTAGDRRFLQTAGPFTLKPGAVNNITFGLPWAQTPIKNQQLYSIPLMKAADDKAQALFDNCFKILNGPDAPELTIQELDQELIIYLTNPPTSNNYAERYEETDVTILPVPGSTIAALANPDRKYRFQGYKVYQLRDETVTQTDLEDQSKARLIFQCDIKDGVTRLINYETDNESGQLVPKVKVDGADKGIVKSFRITTDAFAVSTSGGTANNRLVNHKKYYFMAVAYAYNNYLTYKPDTDPISSPDANYLGQKRPYLEGRKVKKASGIPHINSPEKDGTVMQSYYGYGPKITRIEGQGNGGNILDLTDESVNRILANNFDPNPTYVNGRGPVNVKVIDPLKVKNTTYTLKLMKWNGLGNPAVPLTPTDGDVLNMGAVNPDRATWVLIDNNSGNTYQLDTTIKMGKEYVIPEIGLSITMEQVLDPGTQLKGTTTYTVDRDVYKEGDFLEATMTFAEPHKSWLTGIGDGITSPNPSPFNWIRSGVGTSTEPAECGGPIYGYAGSTNWTDKDNIMANILGGTWAPYCITAFSGKFNINNGCEIYAGPGYDSRIRFNTIGDANPSKVEPGYLSSIDLVITPDKSKWTRCMVIEMQDDPNLAEGGALKFEIRKHPSVDKNGNPGDGVVTNDPNDADYIAAEGMSWFPGYAINVETGERLNIVFGEDSWNTNDNGNDLIWNPTANRTGSAYQYPFGGRHYIYIIGNNRYEVYKTNTSSVPAIAALDGTPIGAGRYDGCKQLYPQWKAAFTNVTGTNRNQVIRLFKTLLHDFMWVNIPVLTSSKYAFKNPSQIPTEVKIRIRVRKPYRYGYSTFYTNTTPGSSPYYADLVSWRFSPFASLLPQNVGSVINVSSNPQNNNFPMYQFSTSDIYTITNKDDIAKNALDIIRVVPNPYYGYSTYEGNRLETKVKITNLPSDCIVKIYTLNGTLIRTLNRNMENMEDQFTYTNDFKQAKWLPYIEWDLKNQNGILVSSGMYIIHIESPKFGEKIIKWFGIMRPYDLQNF
ncbi:MAG: hypothetical protein KatS3mg027_1498 [Bacteroidia bacterium]|nr:MAG: hypothetical protein KatS3mg027_1498 [Bacteroidia bacterium]